MPSEVSKFKLGLFVSGGAAIAIVAITALGAGRYFQDSTGLVTYFTESVQGLEEGASVKYRGVPVGRVSRIHITPTAGFVAVDFEFLSHVFVDENMRPIPSNRRAEFIQKLVDEGARVQLGMVGITGLKYLEIESVDPQKFPVPKMPFPSRRIFIPSIPSAIKTLQADVTTAVNRLAALDYEGIADRLKKLLDSANELLAEVNAKEVGARVSEIAVEVKGAAENIRGATARLNEALAAGELTATVKDARQVILALRSLAQKLDEQAAPAIEDARQLLAKISKAVDEAGIRNLAASAREALDKAGEAAARLAALREDTRLALRQLETTLRAAQRLFDYAERYPNSFLTGRPAPPNPPGR
ncbi:MAG TPA: MlaD family protein [Candidatus Brocadiia bacterium]|nr:MlaD family protein [Candidatus Brocadiia bacterium]